MCRVSRHEKLDMQFQSRGQISGHGRSRGVIENWSIVCNGLLSSCGKCTGKSHSSCSAIGLLGDR